jgi:hypothetical protein
MTTAVPIQAEPNRPPPASKDVANSAIAAAVVLVAALALAWAMQLLQAPFQQHQETEKAVIVTGILLAGVLIAVPGAYLLRTGRFARPETVSLAFLSALSLSLLAVYFFWVSCYVFFPADILTWSESDFINDMLKFSIGYPIYGAPVNHDSYTYVFGPQLISYLLASLAGKAGSIGAYRAIQVSYTALAAFVASLSCRLILRLTWPALSILKEWLWNGFCFASFFLIATNSITNRFAHNLHDDALAQLATVTAFYLLLAYGETRRRTTLAAMVVMTTAGFLIKQSLLIWGGLYSLYLLVWGRSWKRFAVFALTASALFGLTLAACYAIWGRPFFYWIFGVMSHHPISPLRSFQHLLNAWPYYAGCLLGGMAVLRGRRPDALFGAWLLSFLLLAEETYTSGIAWMLNHIGPGSLLAGIWFFAGLASVWPQVFAATACDRLTSWIRAAAVTATLALFFSGMGLVRIPLRPLSDDAYRYVHDIERQFQGQPADRILLDVGTWNYIPNRVIMRDRAPVIGEEGYANQGDFSAFTSRLSAKYYSKILVRGLHASDFWYEDALWPRPRGLRKALLDNYRETGLIRAAERPKDVKDGAEDPYLFGDISILEPRTN